MDQRHTPLRQPGFYNTYAPSDDRGTGNGFIWRNGMPQLHLNMLGTAHDMWTYLKYCEGDPSFLPDYGGIILHPRFASAIATIDDLLRLDQLYFMQATSNPALGGRGDDRFYDPAHRVATVLRVMGCSGTIAGGWQGVSDWIFHALNPNNIQHPVEWLYDRGFWARPLHGPDSVPQPYANPAAPPGLGGREPFYGHWVDTINQGPSGGFGISGQSLLPLQEQFRQYTYPIAQIDPVPAPPCYPGQTWNGVDCAGAGNPPCGSPGAAPCPGPVGGGQFPWLAVLGGLVVAGVVAYAVSQPQR